MSKADNQICVHLVHEILGANTGDLALFLEVSERAVAHYSTGKYRVREDREALLIELADLIVEAGGKRGRVNDAPTPAELVVLRRLYIKNEALLDRVKQRLAVGKANREYALNTQAFIALMEEKTSRRKKDNPIAQIVRVAKARNTRRLRNCTLPQILAMEARVAGLEAKLKIIGKLLDTHDRGWKKRMIEQGKALRGTRSIVRTVEFGEWRMENRNLSGSLGARRKEALPHHPITPLPY
ncbi:MAG: hypothetical protein ACK5W1_05010 [Flavobacteriales bacterium]